MLGGKSEVETRTAMKLRATTSQGRRRQKRLSVEGGKATGEQRRATWEHKRQRKATGEQRRRLTLELGPGRRRGRHSSH